MYDYINEWENYQNDHKYKNAWMAAHLKWISRYCFVLKLFPQVTQCHFFSWNYRDIYFTFYCEKRREGGAALTDGISSKKTRIFIFASNIISRQLNLSWFVLICSFEEKRRKRSENVPTLSHLFIENCIFSTEFHLILTKYVGYLVNNHLQIISLQRAENKAVKIILYVQEVVLYIVTYYT